MIQFYVGDPTQPFFIVTASDLQPGDTWPFSRPNNPFFLIMNMAVGGTVGGTPDAQTGSQLPMLVDYVRHYTPSQVPAPQIATPTPIAVSPGAISGNSTALNLTGAVGTGRVTFSCATTAPKANCVVTSTDPLNLHTVDFSSTTTASATVTVTTAYYAQAGGMIAPGKIGPGKWSLASAAALALMVFVLLRNGREPKRGLALTSLAMIIAVLPSCGGGYGGGGGGGGGNGTPKGNYTVTVNAYTVSSSDVSAPDATTRFNLTVN